MESHAMQMRITVQLWRLLHPPVATRQKPREGDKRNHKTGKITIRFRGTGHQRGHEYNMYILYFWIANFKMLYLYIYM